MPDSLDLDVTIKGSSMSFLFLLVIFITNVARVEDSLHTHPQI